MRDLMADFVPRLRRRIGEAAVQSILVANPARAFAIAAPASETDDSVAAAADATSASAASPDPGAPA